MADSVYGGGKVTVDDAMELAYQEIARLRVALRTEQDRVASFKKFAIADVLMIERLKAEVERLKASTTDIGCDKCGGTGEEWLNVCGGDGWTGKPCPHCCGKDVSL